MPTFLRLNILDLPIKRAEDRHPVSPLRLTAQLDRDLLKELLDAGADPNAEDSYGSPLECASSLYEIALFLNHGANATICKNGRPLSRIFDYYSKIKTSARLPNARFAMDEFRSFKMLLDAGADASQTWNNRHPIVEIIERQNVNSKEKKAIIALLIVRGCSPAARISAANQQSVLTYYKNSTDRQNKEWYDFLRRKHHYQTARQLLIAWYKEEDSLIAKLPLELVHMIGKMIMND